MPVSVHDITRVMVWLLAAVVAIDLAFVCSVMYRRISRGRYFRAKDAAGERLRPILERFLRYELTQVEAVQSLSWVRTTAARDALREMLLAQMRPTTEDRITGLFFNLGAVARWARAAFGTRSGGVMVSALAFGRLPFPERKRNRVADAFRRTRALYVPRVLAVDALGRLSADFAETFALAAMQDPAGEVRRVALHCLARNRKASGIPHILAELRSSLAAHSHLHPREVSARSAKAALVCYGMEHLRHLNQALRDADAEFRWYVVDSIREICAREAKGRPLERRDFPDEMYSCFLMRRVADESADVRARSAPVVAHFHDAQASLALKRLLEDENEFVRLHAVRAAADPAYPQLVPALAARTKERRWRVREAAVRALARMGGEGERALLRQLGESTDRYESEQMTEELERCGSIERVFEQLRSGGEAGNIALAVCRRMVEIGRTAMLEDELLRSTDERERLMLLEAFGRRASRKNAALLERVAAGEWSAVAERAAVLLGEMRGRPAVVEVA